MPAEERGDDMILPNVELKPESIRSSCTRREVRSTWLGTRFKIRFYFNFISFAGNWKRKTHIYFANTRNSSKGKKLIDFR